MTVFAAESGSHCRGQVPDEIHDFSSAWGVVRSAAALELRMRERRLRFIGHEARIATRNSNAPKIRACPGECTGYRN